MTTQSQTADILEQLPEALSYAQSRGADQAEVMASNDKGGSIRFLYATSLSLRV